MKYKKTIYGSALILSIISVLLILAKEDIERLWVQKLREEKYLFLETTFYDSGGTELGIVSYYVPIYSRTNEGTLDMHEFHVGEFVKDKYESMILRSEFSEHRLPPFLIFWKSGHEVYISTAPDSVADAGIKFKVDLEQPSQKSSWSYERMEGAGIGGYIMTEMIEPVAGGDATR